MASRFMLVTILVCCSFWLSPDACGQTAPVVLSDGWPIKAFTLNNGGTVVFAGGANPFSADGIVLVSRREFVKFVSIGDPAPGFENKVFVGFLSNFGPSDVLSLNDRDQVAFVGAVMKCSDGTDPYKCLSTGEPYENGLFVYANGKIDRVIGSGDVAPDSGGRRITFFQQVIMNNRGDLLIKAWIDSVSANAGAPSALFTYSSGRFSKVAISDDPAVSGILVSGAQKMVLDEEGVVRLVGLNGAFHFSGGQLFQDVAAGDPTPGGGTFLSLFDIDINAVGDVAFRAHFGPDNSQQGLFLRRRDGSLTRILADGDPTPIGGVFTLWFEQIGRFGTTIVSSVFVSPKLNNFGDVAFSAPVKGGAAAGALFLYTSSGITPVAVDGDVGPQGAGANLKPLGNSTYTLNDHNQVAFTSALSNGSAGLFQWLGGTARTLAVQGNQAPSAQNESFSGKFSLSSQDDNGDVTFGSGLCCDRLSSGIFLSSREEFQILNGGFETPGENGLPANWQIVWHNSGTGEAVRYDSGGADANSGTSVLRLHVNPGASTFVLSDPMAVLSNTQYAISTWMRYNLNIDSDSVFFSVIQFDSQGNTVGFDEFRGVPGENFWQWAPKRLSIHTAAAAASIRVRFGLVSSLENYLDVDRVSAAPVTRQ